MSLDPMPPRWGPRNHGLPVWGARDAWIAGAGNAPACRRGMPVGMFARGGRWAAGWAGEGRGKEGDCRVPEPGARAPARVGGTCAPASAHSARAAHVWES